MASSDDPPTSNPEALMKSRLGEFYHSTALTVSETRLLLGIVLEKRRANSKTGQVNETPTLTKTQDYLDLFSRYKESKTVQNIDALFTPLEGTFTNIERSQLGSLCPDSAEEAKYLIPSIGNKTSDADLQDLLDAMLKARMDSS